MISQTVFTNDQPIAQRPSIVQLHSTDYGGGAETVVRLNHRALKSIGCSSQLLVAKKTGNDDDIDQIAPWNGPRSLLKVARVLEHRLGLQNLYAPLFRGVRKDFRGIPDVVHVHSLHSGINSWADLTGLRLLAKRFPTVLSLHELFLLTGHCCYGMECERWQIGCGQCPDLKRYPQINHDGTKWNWKRKQKLFASGSFHLIAVSEWVKTQVLKSPILQQTPISVVPNPIDISLFTPGDKRQARKELGLLMDRPIVLLGRKSTGIARTKVAGKESRR